MQRRKRVANVTPTAYLRAELLCLGGCQPSMPQELVTNPGSGGVILYRGHRIMLNPALTSRLVKWAVRGTGRSYTFIQWGGRCCLCMTMVKPKAPSVEKKDFRKSGE
ncbi:hypothetical protein CEXT_29501 [Caerostris extrusa]|uniref:Uncharacterized protein n=1 Tax=Caerostris extrusa TaxID=172846 RepID=A0AAV4XVH8_CAEEX|nr:hypothetical protein CEXT_29501 [Caerostris extrusa]